MTEALVIPDLGALDEFAEAWGLADAMELSARLGRAAFTHEGPVYVADDQRPIAGRASEPRVSFMRLLRRRPDVVWVVRDDGVAGLDRALGDLARGLADDGVAAVVLGGPWFDRARPDAAVNRAEAILLPRFPTAVVREITGFALAD